MALSLGWSGPLQASHTIECGPNRLPQRKSICSECSAMPWDVDSREALGGWAQGAYRTLAVQFCCELVQDHLLRNHRNPLCIKVASSGPPGWLS